MTVFVYVAGHPEGPCKIGISKNPSERVASLQVGCPFKIEILYQSAFDSYGEAFREEQILHSAHQDQRAYGEWFNIESASIIGYIGAGEFDRTRRAC